jgi:hypothetical protein
MTLKETRDTGLAGQVIHINLDMGLFAVVDGVMKDVEGGAAGVVEA